MVTNYSIDELIEKIHNRKTKDYFFEVIQTYYSNCFRSSIVMLYSVVMCDLIFKLQELKDVYNNETAIKLLNEIEQKQKANPTSPDWEIFLIEEINKRTQMFAPSDFVNITHLQKHRHLSAHPTLSNLSTLYKPSKETARAHIKNMLEGILTKPPFMSANIFEDIILDISNLKESLPNKKSIKTFLFSKYLKHLKEESLVDIFKKLWKFVFKLDNKEANINRNINYITLEIISEQISDRISDEIENNKTYYGHDLSKSDESVNYFFKILFKFPKLYKHFDEHTKEKIDLEISKNIKEHLLDLSILSFFKYKSFDEYYSTIITTIIDNTGYYFGISNDTYYLIKDFFYENDYIEKFHDLSIDIFGMSCCFNTADSNYNLLIKPILNSLTINDFKKLIEKIDCNDQLYNRGSSSYDNKEIRKICEEKYPNQIDYKQYRNFNRGLH